MLSTAAAFDAELVAAAANPALRTVIESMGAVGHARCLRGIAIKGDAAMHVGKRQLKAHREILAAIVQQDAHAVECRLRDQVLTSLDLLFELDE